MRYHTLTDYKILAVPSPLYTYLHPPSLRFAITSIPPTSTDSPLNQISNFYSRGRQRIGDLSSDASVYIMFIMRGLALGATAGRAPATPRGASGRALFVLITMMFRAEPAFVLAESQPRLAVGRDRTDRPLWVFPLVYD
ncbi:hypothetical protein EVAR_12531_1 [Eumeta japonica]|uniref:Uncharacterized protein n=1 Tax=Eumeta variegata TaxID=151549 RepID=A0A4C1TPP5_EUMVA|nr:hypothetical protein EVAR_12531_1 [Eumeta japonica]